MKRILCKKSQQLLFREILAFILSHFTLQYCRKYYFKKKRGYQAQQHNDEKYFPFYMVTGSFFSWAPISDFILISQRNCIQSLALLSALSRSGSNFALSDRTIRVHGQLIWSLLIKERIAQHVLAVFIRLNSSIHHLNNWYLYR